MAVLVESIVGCLVFTIIFGGMTYLKPLSMIHDYPPEIQNTIANYIRFSNPDSPM